MPLDHLIPNQGNALKSCIIYGFDPTITAQTGIYMICPNDRHFRHRVDPTL
jgi:hypothetical protein